MKKTIIILLSLIKMTTYAQEPGANLPTVTPASPEAAALAKYINYPVNYSTGLPEIQIPLYEIKSGDLTLPISLSYHASGLKVAELSGWVGAGWTLNAEPSVSRSINGQADENGYLYFDYPPPVDQNYYVQLADGSRDEQPDGFYYKLLSKSGSFYFKKPLQNASSTYEALTHPFEPIKITFDRLTPNKFEIKDEQGVYYRFGTSLNNTLSLEYSKGERTNWRATEVISSSGRDTLSFKYHSYVDEFVHNFYDLITVEDSTSDMYNGSYPCPIGSSGFPIVNEYTGINSTAYDIDNYGNKGSGSGCPRSYTTNERGGTLRAIKISEIDFKSGKVVFEKVDNNLTAIKIYNNSGLLKQIKFYRSYFAVASSDPYANKKTRLDSIHILDASDHVMEHYRFEYNTTPLPDQLLSKDIDYWGYYNATGNDVSKSLVPVMQIMAQAYVNMPHVTTQIGAADREPNEYAMQAGVLTQIFYPTGGSTYFTYEANRYGELDYTTGQYISKLGGGLRIKTIQDVDLTQSIGGYMEFKYGREESGFGFARNKINSASFMSRQYNKYVFQNNGAYYTTNLRTYYSNSLYDLFYAAGPAVLYPEVAEYFRAYSPTSVGETGKTIYKYFNNDGGPMPLFPGTTLVPDSKEEWRYGELLSQEDYRYDGTNYNLMRRKSYTNDANSFKQNTIPLSGIYRNANVIMAGATVPDQNWEDFTYYPYNILTGGKRLIADTTTVIEGAQKLVTVNTYSYNNLENLLPTQIVTTSSDGQTITKTTKYPHDVTLSGNSETARQQLISDWRIATPLEQSTTKGGKTQSTKTDYSVFNSLALPEVIKTNTGAANADEARVRFLAYDTNGKPLSVAKEGGVKICYIWSYKGQYPVAEIKNADYATVENILGSTNIDTFRKLSSPDKTTVDTFMATLKSALSNAEISTFVYNPLVGLTSQTDPKGQTTYYEYDDFQRLINVKDQDGHVIKHTDYHYANQ